MTSLTTAPSEVLTFGRRQLLPQGRTLLTALQNGLQEGKQGKTMGWTNSILGVTDNLNDMAGKFKDFLDKYGQISMERLTDMTQNYVTGESQAAQDSMQLYACLHSLLPMVGCRKINSTQELFHYLWC